MAYDANHEAPSGTGSPGFVTISYAANANSSSMGANCITCAPMQPRTVLDGASDYGSALVHGNGRDDDNGTPPPSIRLVGYSSMRFRVALAQGTRSISVMAKQPLLSEARPQLVIHKNDDIAIAQETATAPDGDGWVKIGPISLSPTADGAIWIELVNPSNGQPAYFDDLTVT